MARIHTKMKGWIGDISVLNLDGKADELREELPDKLNDKETCKSLFKLLLYLSHAAHGCDRTKITIGTEMWRLTECICSKMTLIPDFHRYFLSIFHIAKCLLEMEQYTEAMDIFNFVMPEANAGRVFPNNEELYRKSAAQWKVTIHNQLLKRKDLTRYRTIVILLEAMRYEFDTSKFASPEYSITVLEKICFYCKQVKSIMRRSESSALGDEFETFVLNYVQRNDVVALNVTNKCAILKAVCLVIAELISRNLNGKTIAATGLKTNLYFDPFKVAMKSEESCLSCFRLYQRLCEVLLKPMENFTKTTVEDIGACESDLNSIVDHYGPSGVVKSFLYPVVVIFSSLLTYWEGTAKNKTSAVPIDSIVASLKFFLKCSTFFYFYEPSSCRCGSNDCVAKYDYYGAVALRLKCLGVASRIMSQEASVELNEVAINHAVESVQAIIILKESGCKKWSELWPSVGAYIYNMGICCEISHYNHSVRLHSLLCQNIIYLEGLNPGKPIINLADPLRDVLHRLTSVHYNNSYYEEASIVCSLNGLLSYEKSESKAYRYWANIKRNDPKFIEQPMLDTLRTNREEITQIVDFALEDYNQVQVCLREIKGLQESSINLSASIIAVLSEMEQLNASPESYAQGVQLLCYHLLNFPRKNGIEKYVKKVMQRYEREEAPSVSHRWSYGHLQFYKFIDRLDQMTNKTTNEMKTKAADTPAASAENETDMIPAPNVVPTYSTTSLSLTIELHDSLKLALQRWIEAFACGFKRALKDWEASQALHVVTIAGEYARLFHFGGIEMQIWKFAYLLATELNDDLAIIYVTSRCLLGQRIDVSWIESANESVESVEKSENRDASLNNRVIARYEFSLVLFYFKNNQPDEAKKYYRRAEHRINSDFLTDISNYMIRNDIILNYMWEEYSSNDYQLEYQTIIVEILYAMLTLDSTVDQVPYGKKEWQLSNYDTLLEIANSFAMRINGLLSFQEISAHLALRLTRAQKLGAALRVAQVLKTLCYIDLSRGQLNDCEAKLNGIEQILRIRAYDSTGKNKLFPKRQDEKLTRITPPKLLKRSEDSGQKDASPVLRKNPFVSPDFTLHGDMCECFECVNQSYQYLVFASACIRAQLYSLQGNSEEAFDHFTGAFHLWESILTKISMTVENEEAAAGRIVSLQSQDRFLEYATLHLDYCRFLKFYVPSNTKDMIKYSSMAKEFCETNWLTNHPIYMSVNEFIFECEFETSFGPDMYSKFTVPDPDEMDVSCYLENPEKRPVPCATPARDTVPKEAKGVNRKKNQPFLKLNMVPLNLAEEEDRPDADDEEDDKEEPPISTSLFLSAAKRTRRKLTDPDVSNSRQKSLVPEIKVTTENEKSSGKTRARGKNAGGSSAIRLPLISDDEDDEPSERSKSSGPELDRLTDMIKDLEVQNKSSTRIRKKSQQESVASTSCEIIDEVEELFGGMTMTKPQTSSLASQSQCSKTRKSAKNSDSGRANESSTVSKEIDTIILSSDNESDREDGGKRKSARLQKKSDDLSMPKSSSLKSSDKSACRDPNSESEDVIVTAKTRKRVASSLEQPQLAKQVPKSTRSRATKKST